MNPTPSLETIFDLALSKRLKDVRVSIPGRIERYNPSTQKADVQPLVMEEYVDDLGDRQVKPLPVCTNVPVLFPGVGSWRITGPVHTGDTVMLLFSSSSIDRWAARGGMVDPQDDRHHDLSDAVAIPGLYDFAHLPTDAPNDAVVVHADALKLGGSDASDPVVRRSDLNAVVSWLTTHVHSGGNILGLTGNPTVSLTTPACSPVVKSK